MLGESSFIVSHESPVPIKPVAKSVEFVGEFALDNSALAVVVEVAS